MIKKILVLSVFPAPYRYEVFKLLSDKYDMTVYFERNNDTERNENWFASGNVNILDNEKSISAYNKDVKNISDFDFVFVYDYSTKTAMKLMLRCIIKKIPYAINCDGAFIGGNSLKNTVKSFFIKKATRLFASGKKAAEYFIHYGAKEENIAYHGFTSLFEKDIPESIPSPELKTRLRKERELPEGIIAVSVGRFIKSKAFDVLIDAWSHLPGEYTLLIIGGGSERKSYEEQIKNLGLKNIRIYDYMPFDKLIEYYKCCDIFVMPTLTDVWGLVINEAMANGLPVVTTEMCIAGLELIEKGENGYIVPINDAAALADAISVIAKDENLRLKMAINNLIKIGNYTYENIARSHINALESLEHKK